MMTTKQASEQVLERLRVEAETLSERPHVRLASIERLVMACDAIESGGAAEVHRLVYGTDGGLGRNAKINPSNIDKFVKARLKQGAREWTGPTRVFISADTTLRAYVTARENERLKPLEIRKRPSQRQQEIEDAIAQLSSVEMRQTVRYEIEEGRLARRRLEILTKGLRSLPGIELNSLLSGSTNQQQTHNEGPPQPLTECLPMGDVQLLRALISRLSNPEEMRRAGLELDGNRLRMATPPLTAIIKPLEMEILHRMAGSRQ